LYQFSKSRASGEIRGFISAVAASDEGQIWQSVLGSMIGYLRCFRPLHHFGYRCLASKIVRQPGRGLTPKDLMQRISPHVTIDQQHLAILMARETQSEVG